MLNMDHIRAPLLQLPGKPLVQSFVLEISLIGVWIEEETLNLQSADYIRFAGELALEMPFLPRKDSYIMTTLLLSVRHFKRGHFRPVAMMGRKLVNDVKNAKVTGSTGHF